MAGFMAGFGTTLSKSIETDRESYRESAAKRRDYIQTYGTRAVVDREDKANAALATINALKTVGVDEDSLRYVLDTSGIAGIAQLKGTIDSRSDLSKDDIAGLVNKAKGYVSENPDEDINTVVKRAYGLYKSTDNPVKRERNLFSAMLGLDSRMMEEDVLDDMYVNGYTGRDIYRIMGSSGPKAGAALDINLPIKPPSPQVLNMTSNTLLKQFETSIDSRIGSLKTAAGRADPKTDDYANLMDQINTLEALKGKGLTGMGEYASAYDPSLFDFARAQEEFTPGSITRNASMFAFTPFFEAFYEESEEKAAETGEDTGGEDVGGAPITSPVESTSADLTFSTAEAFNKAADSGKIKPGDSVTVRGRNFTFEPPVEGGAIPKDEVVPKDEDETTTAPKVTRPGTQPAEITEPTADLLDFIQRIPEKDREEYTKIYLELEESVDLQDILAAAGDKGGDIADVLGGKIVGGALWGLSVYDQALNRAAAFLSGNNKFGAQRAMASERMKNKALDIMSNGIVESIQGLVDETGFTGSWNAKRAKSLIKEDKGLQKALELKARIADSDRQFLADERNYPQPMR